MGKSVDLRCTFMIVFLLFLSILVRAEALWLNLPAKGTKCVSEELRNHVVVLGEFVVIGDSHTPSPTISLKVTSPFGKTIQHNENVTHGQFAFTTSETGNYQACFSADHPEIGDLSVNIDWKTGIAAKDWKSVAKKENIEGLELEFRKLEGAVTAILEHMNYLMTRELELRSVSDMTNSRVAWFSLMSLGVCIAASIVQIVYLKHYFQKKKLI